MSEVEKAVEVLKESGWQWNGGALRPTWIAQELARELINHPIDGPIPPRLSES